MSKSSTATASKPTQLPTKSAWSKGPPQTTAAPSPRSASPAPNQGPSQPTHSRRPSVLGQGVSFKDGARSPTNTTKPANAVTFGSINDASAPISSSPAAVPTIKAAAVSSFGSVAATPTPAPNGKAAGSSSHTPTSVATQSKPKFDVKKLFQNPGSAPPVSNTPSQAPSDVASPSSRPSPLPHPSPLPSHAQAQPPQMGAHQPYHFVPRTQNGGPPTPGGPPRSPVYPRQMPNGQMNGVNGRPSGASASTPVSAGMSSPRLGPPHGGQLPAGVPQTPQQGPPQWYGGGYYSYSPYSGMPPPEHYVQYTPWMQPQMVGTPHQQTQGLPGPPQPGMPMSPRNLPPQLHPPGTPTTMTPALPNAGHPPHPAPSPHTHTSSLSSVSSPPPTPSTTGPGRLNTYAPSFQPRTPISKVVKITSVDGRELQLDALKKTVPVISPAVPASPVRKAPVRLEKPEDKEKRLAEEQRERAKKEAGEKAKKETEEKAKREAEEKARKQKEEEERKKTEEQERVRREKERQEEERRKKEEEEQARQEAEKAKEEEEQRRDEEERLKAEEEKVATTNESLSSATGAEPEEGELDEPEARSAEGKKASETEEAEEKSQDKGVLRINTALASPETPRKRHPGPLDLSSTRTQAIAQPLPSALATARIIEDLGSVSYPEGIRSPKIELNVNAKHGKFRYDRDFLMQFMKICKDKPDNLPPLDAIGLEPSEQGAAVHQMSRGGSQRRSASAMGPPSAGAPRQGLGLGLSNLNGPTGNNFNMGRFATSSKTSEERFKESQMGRSTSMTGGPPGVGMAPFVGRPSPMVRSSSQGGPSAMDNKRTRSKRGVDRGQVGKPGSSFGGGSSLSQQGGMPLEPVAPLAPTANRWQPQSLGKKPQQQQVETDSPEIVDRKVRGLLNKLTMERFDSISDQIIAWANKSENEHDGRTLIQVIRLVFEKATDEAAWSEMYARLCRKMMEQISPKVQDEGIKNAEGKPIAGGQLFRKYLLNRCQEDFERGWAAKETAAAAAATKASEDQAAKAAAEKDESGEAALYSEEYYIAQKAKRQGLGLIKFIGELFKLQMLTERIMHECVKKLLGNVENPEEEEIESLVKLIGTVGQLLDTPKARAHMDVYFTRMKELLKNPNINSRMQFMLIDLLELRERKWISRHAAAGPTTISAVHALAAKETAAKEKDYQRTMSMSRGGSRRGGDRGEHQVGPDGWAVAGAGNAPPRAPPKAGDLTHFGKISKTNSMTFGPTGVFAKDKAKRESASLSRGSSNMFSKLMENPELAAEAAIPTTSSRPPSRKPSVDLGSSAAEPLQRRKLNLLPRTVPKPDETRSSTPAPSDAAHSDGEDSGAPSMSEEEATTKVGVDLKEFFAIRDLDEAEVYFTKLPSEHRWLLVDKLVVTAIESKEADAQLVGDFFSRAVSKNLCSPDHFEKGFTSTVEILDDIAIDAPKAFSLMALMMTGAQLDDERRTRLASKLEDSTKLTSRLS